MNDITFLSYELVITIHKIIITNYGGTEGIRDKGLLESALAQPEMQLFGEYIYHDVFEMAAAYCFHIIKNHPFVDGNKRTGLAVTLDFLELNGYEVKASPIVLYALTMSVATSKITKEEVAVLLKNYSIRIEV